MCMPIIDIDTSVLVPSSSKELISAISRGTFGGEVDIASVTAHSLDWDENAGHLSKVRIDESKIAPENRIPRVTAATW